MIANTKKVKRSLSSSFTFFSELGLFHLPHGRSLKNTLVLKRKTLRIESLYKKNTSVVLPEIGFFVELKEKVYLYQFYNQLIIKSTRSIKNVAENFLESLGKL